MLAQWPQDVSPRMREAYQHQRWKFRGRTGLDRLPESCPSLQGEPPRTESWHKAASHTVRLDECQNPQSHTDTTLTSHIGTMPLDLNFRTREAYQQLIVHGRTGPDRLPGSCPSLPGGPPQAGTWYEAAVADGAPDQSPEAWSAGSGQPAWPRSAPG